MILIPSPRLMYLLYYCNPLAQVLVFLLVCPLSIITIINAYLYKDIENDSQLITMNCSILV